MGNLLRKNSKVEPHLTIRGKRLSNSNPLDKKKHNAFSTKLKEQKEEITHNTKINKSIELGDSTGKEFNKESKSGNQSPEICYDLTSSPNNKSSNDLQFSF